MLMICSEPLPACHATYIAFRLACCDTLERMVLAEQVDDPLERPFGYLTQVPFLRNVPPHVQIDLLVDVWHKHRGAGVFAATLLDESVVYAVCETAARLVVSDVRTAERLLADGPVPAAEPPSERLSREIQAVHLNLANEGDFLLLSQFQDIPTDEATALKLRFGLDPAAAEPMFEALGRWHVSADFVRRACGLLTSVESARAQRLFPAWRSSRSLP